jgi:formylglycine-generating enzyme required for sulfatase activity
MNEPVVTRPQRIASMKAAMEELARACASMRHALRETNDERHQAFFSPVLDRLGMIVANEHEGITFVLADDLSNVRSALRRLRLPDIDPVLDAPTPALKALRGERGNLIEAIDNALDAAAFLRLHPRFSEFGGIYIERHEIAEHLIRLDERLRVVQDAVVDLQSAAAAANGSPGAGPVSQSGLVNVHVKTLTVEVSGARFETRVGSDAAIPHDSDISALTRSIEAMSDIAADLKQAVEGLGEMMAAGVRAVGRVVVKTVERSRRGLKTVVSAVRRKLQSSSATGPDMMQPAPQGAPGEFSPGARFRDFEVAPQMIVVPAGEFMMGSPDGEGEDEEHPQHKVTIANPFAVSIAPITRGEFAAFIHATNHEIEAGAYAWNGQDWIKDSSKSWRDPGFRQDDDHPVVCVNWHDAQAYVAWLNERSGKSYRLLSEAEWEYCCRAGTTSPYNTGDNITSGQANFGMNYQGTTSVFKFSTNAFGLHDMHGNVWEWCEDNWHYDYEGNPPSDGSVWRRGDRSLRVLRGGSWISDPQYLRSAIRFGILPGDRSNYVGFRVARTL